MKNKIQLQETSNLMANERDFGQLNRGAGASIERYVKLLYRLKYILAVWIGFCLIVALIYINFTSPIYTATGTVLLDPRRNTSVASDSTNSLSQITLDNAQAESQLQVVRSERLLTKVFQALNLADSDELHPKSLSAREYIANKITWLSNAQPTRDQNAVANGAAAAFQNFMSRVGARRVGQSYVIEVSYTSSRPSDARKLANAVLSAYLGQQISYKLAAAQNGAEYLQGRLTSLNNQIKAADQAIEEGRVPDNFMPDADARIIGAAPEPLGKAWPKNGLIIAAALAFGIFTGIFIATIYGSLDKKARTVEQLEDELSLEVMLCKLRRESRFSVVRPSRITEQQYGIQRRLRLSLDNPKLFIDKLLLLLPTENKFSVAFVSCNGREARKIIIKEFFNSIRQQDQKIILVNMPGLSEEDAMTDFAGHSETVSIDCPNAASGFLELKTETLSGGGEYISSQSIVSASSNAKLTQGVVSGLIAAQASKFSSMIVSFPDENLNFNHRTVARFVDVFFIIAEIGKTSLADIEALKRAISKNNSDSKISVLLAEMV